MGKNKCPQIRGDGFNLALLGKQLWRMSVFPQSLMARVFKGRYFPKSTPLEAKLGTRPSFAWRSIHAAQSLMKKGMRLELGNGENIDLLRDPWLPDVTPRPPGLKEGVDMSNISFSLLKEDGSDEWRVANLYNIFLKEDADLILQLRPGKSTAEDVFSWIHNQNGMYTVKSGYWVWLNMIKSLGIAKPVENPNLNPLFKAIWQVQTMPKIQNFLWRSLSNSLAVASNMAKKRLTKAPECLRCGYTEETVNHVLFQCPFARLAWALSPAAGLLLPEPTDSIYTNMASCLLVAKKDSSQQAERFKMWPWLLWKIWKARNDLCFSDTRLNIHYMVQKATEEASEWFVAMIEDSTQLASHSSRPVDSSDAPSKWIPPPPYTLKCNIDAAWSMDSEKCGVGWILRDEHGNLRWYGVKTYPKLRSALDAEAAALLWAMSCLDNLGFSEILFESDSQTLIQAIKYPSNWPRMKSYTSEILGPRNGQLQPSFRFFGRQGNTCADQLAKAAMSCNLYFASLDCSTPFWLQPVVEREKPCMVPSIF